MIDRTVLAPTTFPGAKYLSLIFAVSLLTACSSGDETASQQNRPEMFTVYKNSIETSLDEGDTAHAYIHGSAARVRSDEECERWILIDLGYLGSDTICVSYRRDPVYINWTNRTTGESGSTEGIYSGYKDRSSTYSWTAYIPIAAGKNKILLTSSTSATQVSVIVDPGIDMLQPEIISAYPSHGSDNVAYTASITANFSESIDPSTLNTDSFFVSTIEGDIIYGEITLSETGTTAYLRSHNLYADTQYFATLTTDILDISGKPLSDAYSWSFSTGEGDYDPPVVTTTPKPDEIDYSPFETISASFDELIDHTTISADSMSLFDEDQNPVAGMVSIISSGSIDSLIFKPTQPLQPSTSYTVTLSSSISDISGNALASDYSWSFTSAPPDVTPPTVSQVAPSYGDYCVPLDQTINVGFDENMAPSSLDSSSFLLTDIDGKPVAGTVSVADDTADFQLAAPLDHGMQYQATITDAVTDLSGNPMEEAFSWVFSTATPTGSWTELSTENAPARSNTAVWSGEQMIVWHSWDGSGGRYNVDTDSWTAMSTIDAPTRRQGDTTVWTGKEMIIWGGNVNWPNFLNDGARYDPATDTWQTISTAGAPSARSGHIAVWTGEEMIIWGGYIYNGSRNAASYDPVSDTWTQISYGNVHIQDTEAAWTGTEMIVIPNQDYYGRSYNPETNRWREIARDPERDGKKVESIVWTGEALLARGKDYFSSYDPITDLWTSLPTECSTQETNMIVAGDKVIVHGQNSTSFYSGGIFDLTSRTWSSMRLLDDQAGSYGDKAVWTGEELVTWGRDSGGRYMP